MKNSSTYALPTGIQMPPVEAILGLAESNAAERHSRSECVKLCSIAAAKFVGSLMLSLVAGWSCMGMVSYAFDGGYQLIGTYCGQPGSQQGVIAAMALWFAILPAASSFVFGWCKAMLKGSRLWAVVPAIAVVLAISFDFIADGNFQAIGELIPWIAFATTFAYAGYFMAQALAKRTRSNSNAIVAYPIALASFLPAGYCAYIGLGLSSTTEMSVIAMTMALAAYMFTRNCGDQRISRALRAALLALAPVMVPLVLNVLGNCISLYLDQFGMGAHLGWRALASAQAILMIAATGMMVGTALACFRNARLNQNRSVGNAKLSLDSSGNYMVL
jgi:hypothetical protein